MALNQKVNGFVTIQRNSGKNKKKKKKLDSVFAKKTKYFSS